MIKDLFPPAIIPPRIRKILPPLPMPPSPAMLSEKFLPGPPEELFWWVATHITPGIPYVNDIMWAVAQVIPIPEESVDRIANWQMELASSMTSAPSG